MGRYKISLKSIEAGRKMTIPSGDTLTELLINLVLGVFFDFDVIK